MTTSSPVFKRSLLVNLRKAVIVIAVVSLGLGMYALSREESVQWKLVAIVAGGMLASAFLNAGFDSMVARRRGK